MLNRFFSRRRRRNYFRGGSDTLPEGWTSADWTEELYRRAQFADTQPPLYPLSPDEEFPPTPMVMAPPVMAPPVIAPIMSPQELFEELYASEEEKVPESPEDAVLVGLQFSDDSESESSSESSSSSSDSNEELFTEPESDFTTESYFSRNDTPYP